MEAMEAVTLLMRAAVWNSIDGAMDNRASSSAMQYSGDRGDATAPDNGPICRFANTIRDEGWRQLSEEQRQRPDAVVSMSPGRKQWQFILRDAYDNEPEYELLAEEAGDDLSAQAMAAAQQAARETINILTAALGSDEYQS